MRDLTKMDVMKQEGMACGTTSLAMVIHFLTGEKITFKDIDKDIRRGRRISACPIDLVNYARKKGLQARQYNHQTINKIKEFAGKGIPMIAFIDPTPGDKELHWVVILGTKVTDDQEWIINNNPWDGLSGKSYEDSWTSFEKQWAHIIVTLKALKFKIKFKLGYDKYFIGVGTKEDTLDPEKITDLFELLAGNTFEKGMVDVLNGWAHIRKFKLGGLCQLLFGVARFVVGTICLIPMNIYWLLKGDFKHN